MGFLYVIMPPSTLSPSTLISAGQGHVIYIFIYYSLLSFRFVEYDGMYAFSSVFYVIQYFILFFFGFYLIWAVVERVIFIAEPYAI